MTPHFARWSRWLFIAFVLILVVLLSPSGRATHAQSSTTNSQRIEQIALSGGAVTAALPLADGSLLAAEGPSLIRLLPDEPPQILGRVDLAHDAVVDLAEGPPFIYALTEDGLVVLAGDPSGMPRPAGFAPGGGQALAAQGDLVVIAAREAGLRIVRVDPSGAPTTSAALSLPGPALDVALAPGGLTAYVAGGEAGVLVIDLSDPTLPRLASVFDSSASVDSIALVGGLLAVGTRGPEGGGRVATLDPVTGAVVGLFAPISRGSRLTISGEYLYVADASDGLKILWLAAPDHPLQIYGEVNQPAYDVLVDGDTAYIASVTGLRILDVANRSRPLEIARLPIESVAGTGAGQPAGVDVSPDGRVFLALGDEGLAVIDASNLSAPRLTRRIPPLDDAVSAVLFDEGYLFAAAGDAGLAVIDARTPGTETLLDVIPLPGPASDLARRGDVLYMAAGEAGLVALDVTQPQSPRLVGVLPPPTGEAALTVTISGKRTYVGHGEDGFSVIDVTQPDQMALLTHEAIPAEGLAFGDGYLYAMSGNQIAVLDAGATAEPTLIRTYRGLGQIADMAAFGDEVLVTSAGYGPDLAVVSFAVSGQPYEADRIGSEGHTPHIAIGAGRAVLSAGAGGARVYDIAESGALLPAGAYSALPEIETLAGDSSRLILGGRSGWLALSPDGILGSLIGGLAPRAAALDGDLLAVAAGDEGLALYSLADPTEPVLIAQVRGSGLTMGAALDADHVYAADSAGLAIYDRRYLAASLRVRTYAPVTSVIAHDGLVYLTQADGALAVIDPGGAGGGVRILSSIPTNRPADLIPVPGGGIVYALADTTLMRLDAGDPARLDLLGSGTLPHVAGRGFLLDGFLAALTPGEAFRIYDPSSLDPPIIAYGEVVAPVLDAVFEWPIGYAAYGQGGLGLVDVPTRAVGAPFYIETVNALYREGATLFAVGTSLSMWDISAPTSPRLLAELPLTVPGDHLAAGADGLLLVSTRAGLTLVQRDGDSLVEVGSLITPAGVDRAAMVGDHAVLTGHDGGLIIADISDPAHPAALYGFTSPSGQFAYDLLPLDESHLLVSWEGGIDALEIGPTADAPAVLAVLSLHASTALDVALSADGSHAVAALGEEGAALVALDDPANPRLVGHADTPGAGLAAALADSALFVADGICGLRIFNAERPALGGVSDLAETGYWRGGFVADVLAGSDGTIYAGGANHLATLRYDPSLPPISPPAPQFPEPAADADGILLDTVLAWGPPADPCDPLTYRVYFGQTALPPLLGQVVGEPRIEVADLAPVRTYNWRVDVTDRQGDTVSGPLWRFTTLTADYAGAFPPAPPTFLIWLEEHPEIALGLVGLLAIIPVIALLRRIRPRPAPPLTLDDAPDWYSGDDTLDSESESSDNQR